MKIKLFLIILVSIFIFSFKLGTIPAGLTIDEASFGYNAVLLSRTMRDENQRLLPIFILSINGTDWRQPITQYFIAGLFKFFEPSVFTLRFTSVIVGAASVGLIYILGGITASILLILTPVFFMHTHLALDNIMPVPFILIWLIFLKRFFEKKDLKSLVVAGIAIGLGFYSYKGIRVFVPVWLLLSSLFIFIKGKTKPVFYYLLGILPFFIIIPYLEFKYAGAVLNNTTLEFREFYRFIYRYLSNFDLSFLFGKGDDMLIHSTGMHGAILLTTLPLFIIGISKSWNKGLFQKFLIMSFFLGPLLFGFFGLTHRASKMISLIPFYVLIASFGANWLFLNKRKFFVALSSLILINFLSFVGYYWFSYADNTKHLFYNMSAGGEYGVLKEISINMNLTPYVDAAKVSDKFNHYDFMRSIYFTEKPKTWDGDIKSLPLGSVLMTDNQNIEGLKKLDKNYENYVFYINDLK